jgi:HSP20 family molecular chaperone IbpA
MKAYVGDVPQGSYTGDGYWYDWWNPWRVEQPVYHFSWNDCETASLLRQILDEIKHPTNKLPKELVSEQFPPSDVIVDKSGRLEIDVALAGYLPSEIIAAYDGDYLVITHKKMSALAVNEAVYLQHGIKQKDGDARFFVDPVKYDHAKTEITYKNGMLTVFVGVRMPDSKIGLVIKTDDSEYRGQKTESRANQEMRAAMQDVMGAAPLSILKDRMEKRTDDVQSLMSTHELNHKDPTGDMWKIPDENDDGPIGLSFKD